jgi:acetyl esterase/lipase
VWFVPREGAGDAVVLYLHGGAYVFGSTRTHGDLMARLGLAAKARVLGLDYRLAPEHPFPAALEDTVAAYRWLLASGVGPERVVLAGDSAGGGLAVAAMLKLREQGVPLPAGGVLLAPWMDLECSGQSMVSHEPYDWGDRAMLLHWARWYVGKASPREPLVSPTHASLSGLPPLFMQVGSAELQHDDVTRFAQTARAAGVRVELEVWPEMVHNFQTFGAGFPESERAVARLGEAVRALAAGQALPSVAAPS